MGTPVAGFAVDRIGSRLALIGGPALVVIAALASMVTPWFAVLLAASFLVGVGESLWAFGREIAGVDLVTLSQRGRVLSGFHGIHGAGLTLGPLFGGLLADNIGIDAVFLVVAVESAVAIGLGTLVGNSKRHVAPRATIVGEQRPSSRSPLTWWGSLKGLVLQISPGLRVTYVTLVFATFAGFLFRQGYQSLLPVFADEELGLTATQIGALFSVAGVIVLILTLPAGFIIDKVGRKWATVPSTVLPGIAFFFVPFTSSFLVLVPLVAVMGVANGLSLGSLATSTYDVAPPAVRGRLQALRRTIADIGAIGAPGLGGILTDAYGPAVAFVAYAPVILLAGLMLALFAKETLVKEKKVAPA
jgi:MFS family permease